MIEIALELRAFAERLLLTPDLEAKLAPVSGPFTDLAPGPATRPERPARPTRLQFGERRTAPAMPAKQRLAEPKQRGIAHHIMANHELQAVEAMAWVLLAFPDAPPEFRMGMAGVIADEQRHTRMHVERARKLGVEFGDFPVNWYIWRSVLELQSVLEYVACLPLVFEGANLDHSLELADAFDGVGDTRSAQLMRIIHHDEIEHVRFGLDWLRRLKPPEQSDWDTFERSLHFPLRASKARGEVFQSDARRDAGMTDDFIGRLRASDKG